MQFGILPREMCQYCNGRGFVVAWNYDEDKVIRRCDECEVFENDDRAVEFVASSYVQLRAAIAQIEARLKTQEK